MRGTEIIMSMQDIERLKIIEQIKSGGLSQVEGARLLGLTTRHLRRLERKYEKEGALGLVSGHRNKRSNHRLPESLKQLAIEIVTRDYADFGPTLAAEYLLERHQIKLGVETLRKLMIEAGLWNFKHRKKKIIHQQRLRRSRFGEMIQLDGSYHDWFEGRSEKCCLLVLIDDATSKIVSMLFCDAETTQNYFKVINQYIKQYGMPMSFYSDKHGIFRVNIKEAQSGNGLTQFGRAMEQLGIELINAHSPQAKGRVERANSTLQDRLIKAMRIDGVNNIDEGNEYLQGFIEKHNKQFAKPPQCDANAHCELQLDNGALDHVLSLHSKRLLTSNLECSYNNVTYQIQAQESKYRLQKKEILICESAVGEVTIFYEKTKLNYQVLDKHYRAKPILDDKTLNPLVDKIAKRKSDKPRQLNPWRKFQINPRKAQLKKEKSAVA